MREEEEIDETTQYNLGAIELINDPQGYCQKVFGVLRRCQEKI